MVHTKLSSKGSHPLLHQNLWLDADTEHPGLGAAGLPAGVLLGDVHPHLLLLRVIAVRAPHVPLASTDCHGAGGGGGREN